MPPVCATPPPLIIIDGTPWLVPETAEQAEEMVGWVPFDETKAITVFLLFNPTNFMLFVGVVCGEEMRRNFTF